MDPSVREFQRTGTRWGDDGRFERMAVWVTGRGVCNDLARLDSSTDVIHLWAYTSSKGAKVVITRGRLFAIVGLVLANLFASRALGGLVLISRSSSLNYANSLGGVDFQKTSQTTNLGVYNDSVTFNQSDNAGSRGSTLSHQSTDVEFSGGSIFSSGHVLAQALASPVGSETMNLAAGSKVSFTFDVVGQPELYQLFINVDSSESDYSNVNISLGSTHSGSSSFFSTLQSYGGLGPDRWTMSFSLNATASGAQASDHASVWYTFKAGPVLAIPLPPAWANGGALLAIAATAHALRGRLGARKGPSLFGIAGN